MYLRSLRLIVVTLAILAVAIPVSAAQGPDRSGWVKAFVYVGENKSALTKLIATTDSELVSLPSVGGAIVLTADFPALRQRAVELSLWVTSSEGKSFQRGDLIGAVASPQIITMPDYWEWETAWWTPEGELRTLNEVFKSRLLYFGAQGFLNVTWAQNPVRHDVELLPTGPAPSILYDVQAMTMARDGTSFLVSRTELRRHAPGGQLMDTWTATPRFNQINNVDLNTDQCTLVMGTSEGLLLFDGCRMNVLATLRPGAWRGARFLPDGTILASSDTDWAVYRLSSTGQVIAKVLSTRAAIALAPDASFAWLAEGKRFYRMDLRTNEVKLAFTTPVTREESVGALAVYGEWTAARGEGTYANPIEIESVTGFDARPGQQVTIHGRWFIRGAQVTIGGIWIPAPNVGESRITFTMPEGTKSDRQVVITNPNGATGRYEVPRKRRAV